MKEIPALQMPPDFMPSSEWVTVNYDHGIIQSVYTFEIANKKLAVYGTSGIEPRCFSLDSRGFLLSADERIFSFDDGFLERWSKDLHLIISDIIFVSGHYVVVTDASVHILNENGNVVSVRNMDVIHTWHLSDDKKHLLVWDESSSECKIVNLPESPSGEQHIN